MQDKFDVLVIGTGMAGMSAAGRIAKAGKRVGIVDSRPYGGTCVLRGCDPKKVLVGAAEIIDWQRRMSGLGITGAALGDDGFRDVQIVLFAMIVPPITCELLIGGSDQITARARGKRYFRFPQTAE